MADDQSAYDQLYERHQRFVDVYFKCGMNATEAARRCDYSNPNVYGPTLVNRSDVKNAIHERMREQTMAADEVLYRLDQQARAHPSDVFEVDDDGNPRIDWQRVLSPDSDVQVKSIEWTKHGPKIKLPDQQNALRLLGKAYGQFKDRVQHEGGESPVRIKYDSNTPDPDG